MNTYSNSSVSKEIRMFLSLIVCITLVLSTIFMVNATIAQSDSKKDSAVKPVESPMKNIRDRKPPETVRKQGYGDNQFRHDHPLKKRFLYYVETDLGEVKTLLDSKMMNYYNLSQLSTSVAGGKLYTSIVLERKPNL